MPTGDMRRPPPSLATKLDRLFQAIRPAGRSEYSYQEVADAIRGDGGPTISATYLWQLRKGIRDNPTRNHLAALARFFGVSPAYFFDDDAAEVVDAQLSLLAAMRDASVRSVALRAAGLSVESLAAVQVVIDHARRLEGLEADSGAAGPGAAPPPGRPGEIATSPGGPGEMATSPARQDDGQRPPALRGPASLHDPAGPVRPRRTVPDGECPARAPAACAWHPRAGDADPAVRDLDRDRHARPAQRHGDLRPTGTARTLVPGPGFGHCYGSSVVAARALGVQGPFIRTAAGVIQALFGALIVLVAAGGVPPAAQRWPVVRLPGPASRIPTTSSVPGPTWTARCGCSGWCPRTGQPSGWPPRASSAARVPDRPHHRLPSRTGLN